MAQPEEHFGPICSFERAGAGSGARTGAGRPKGDCKACERHERDYLYQKLTDWFLREL